MTNTMAPLALILLLSILAQATVAQVGCPGDCDGDGPVSISELVRGDDLGLQGCIAPPDACLGDHLHRVIRIDGIEGGFIDQNGFGCGHGKIVESQPGRGPDHVPGC